MALTSTENNGNINSIQSSATGVSNSSDLFPSNETGRSDANVNSSVKAASPKTYEYDYSEGHTGFGNWLRNMFSFGEYNKDRDARYQQFLNNTEVQRRMQDLKNSGINPVLAAAGGGASSTASAGMSKDTYNANPFNSASKKRKEGADMLKTLMPLLMAVLL